MVSSLIRTVGRLIKHLTFSLINAIPLPGLDEGRATARNWHWRFSSGGDAAGCRSSQGLDLAHRNLSEKVRTLWLVEAPWTSVIILQPFQNRAKP